MRRLLMPAISATPPALQTLAVLTPCVKMKMFAQLKLPTIMSMRGWALMTLTLHMVAHQALKPGKQLLMHSAR